MAKVAAAMTSTDGHEHGADAVGEALDGRLGALGPLHQLDDAGQRRVVADARGADERVRRWY